MDCSTPGFPVLHYLPEFAQTHVHSVGDAIQSSHPLLSPSPQLREKKKQTKEKKPEPPKSKNKVIFWSVGGEDLCFEGGDTIQPTTLRKLDNQFHKHGKFFFWRRVGWLLSGITFSLHLLNCFLLHFLPFGGSLTNICPLKKNRSILPPAFQSHLTVCLWASGLPSGNQNFLICIEKLFLAAAVITPTSTGQPCSEHYRRMSLKTLEPMGVKSRPITFHQLAFLTFLKFLFVFVKH